MRKRLPETGEFLTRQIDKRFFGRLPCQRRENDYSVFSQNAGEFLSPPVSRVVLYDLHAGVWWGGFLFALGLFYFFRFSPARERKRMAESSQRVD